MRENYIIKVDTTRETDIGSCYVKNLELLFQYYGYDFRTYTIEGICQCLDVLYRPCNIETEQLPIIFVNKSYEIETKLKSLLPVSIERRNMNSFSEAKEMLKKEIREGHPICIALNTYHIPYSKDYHQCYGGIFKSYHMALVKGYSDEKEEIYVVDPALYVDHGVISYLDLEKAWSDGTGINRDYKAFVYYEFNVCSKIENLEAILQNSVRENLEAYFDCSSRKVWDILYQSGYAALERMCKDIKKLSDDVVRSEYRDKCYETIFNGMFHLIRYTRWTFAEHSRKCFEALPSELNIDELFQRWSDISQKFAVMIKLDKMDKICECADGLYELIQCEKTIYKEMLYIVNTP